MEWNSRSRIEAAFAHREPDRTPIFEYVLLGERAEDILGRPIYDYTGDMDAWLEQAVTIGFEEALRDYARDRIDIASLLGHDMLYVCPNPIPGSPYVYDPLSVLDEQFDLQDFSDPVLRVRERNIRVERDLSAPLPPDSYLVFNYLRQEMDKREMDLPIFAPAYFHGIWNDTDLMQTLLLDTEAAQTHFKLATRRAFSIIDDYRTLGIEMIGIGGDFAGQVPLISPDAYKTFIVPEVRILSDYIHSTGGLSINATDGNLWSVIDDFLIGCGVDGYMEIDYGAGMELGKLKKSFGRDITFMGNMDCGNILSFSTVEEISRLTHEILDTGAEGGGHIFSASNAITPSIPIENYMAMVNAYREHFSLPGGLIIKK
jgi:hypothetical protein